jgi:hypothetical protein
MLVLQLAEGLGVGARATLAGIGGARRRILERAGRRGTVVAGRERQIPVQEVIASSTGDAVIAERPESRRDASARAQCNRCHDGRGIASCRVVLEVTSR